MKNIFVHRAQPTGNQDVEIARIVIDTEIPDTPTMKEADTLFTIDAAALENVLHETLPGGTYDRLLSAMLKRKSSHFVVAHGAH